MVIGNKMVVKPLSKCDRDGYFFAERPDGSAQVFNYDEVSTCKDEEFQGLPFYEQFENGISVA